ncbi:MAG: hydrogenase 4 subunit F [Candidatus Omnitrophica bacterium]|nr:hydrogenase 4 subunit F [Candidatus Omnitrophota bacterium]
MILNLLIVPLIAALFCQISPTIKVNRFSFVAGALASAVLGWRAVFFSSFEKTVFAMGGKLLMDPLSAVFVLLIVSVGLLSVVYGAGYLFREDSGISFPKLRRYTCFFHLFLFTMLLTVLSNNLGIMWIAIEGTTLASAFLVNVDDKKSSIEAAWKYLILCTVGIALALFGIILVYYSAVSGAAGESKDSLNWTFLLEHARQLNPEVMKLAFIFILVGYGTKAGLAPFHSWLPDAHSQAPSPVSALLSGVLLSCATLGILRFHLLTQAATGSLFSSHLLVFFGILSVAVAVPFILEQADYKRLFAYSSVEHMGLVVTGIGFGSPLAIYGAIFHVIVHAFNKSLLFFSCGHLLYHFETKEIKKVRGILRTRPFLGVIFFLGTMAITGLPPFGTFVSEFMILSGGFSAHRWAACGILLFLLVFIFAGFLRHASRMTFGESSASGHSQKNLWMDGVLLAGMVLILVMGFYLPSPLHQLIQKASVIAGGVSS